MTRDVIKVRADAPQDEAARLLQRHDFISLPVVDADDRLVGIITVDDVIDVLQEGFSEDYMRLVGTDAEAMARRSPFQAARLRLPWLLGTMGIEFMGTVFPVGVQADWLRSRDNRRPVRDRFPGRRRVRGVPVAVLAAASLHNVADTLRTGRRQAGRLRIEIARGADADAAYVRGEATRSGASCLRSGPTLLRWNEAARRDGQEVVQNAGAS